MQKVSLILKFGTVRLKKSQIWESTFSSPKFGISIVSTAYGAYLDHAYAQNLTKPPFMRICRDFENWRDLRALSGKFLRQKSCYSESFCFLWLWNKQSNSPLVYSSHKQYSCNFQKGIFNIQINNQSNPPPSLLHSCLYSFQNQHISMIQLSTLFEC